MKKRTRGDEGNGIEGSKSINMKYKNKKLKDKKKMRGLSLEAFANAKSKSNHYNPALIKKQREFYKNAKHVTKYRKSLKQQSQPSELSSATRPREDDNITANCSKTNRKSKKPFSLRELYEKKHEEEEKERTEREAIIQAKKEEREKANARRKATRQMMFKKTRTGQPVMKYRIEHLLESLQGAENVADRTSH